MTFTASKSHDVSYGRKHVDVQLTYGIITVKVTEDVGHLRSFHTQLGRLLDDIEAEELVS